MAKTVQSIGAAFLLAAISAPAIADDVKDGRVFAEQACRPCHDIERTGAADQMPPSFAEISASRSPDEIRERIIAPPPTSAMPLVGLKWANGEHAHDVVAYPGYIDDLVAYIRSLARP